MLKVVLFTLVEYYEDHDFINHHGFERRVSKEKLFSKRSGTTSPNLQDGMLGYKNPGKIAKVLGESNISTLVY